MENHGTSDTDNTEHACRHLYHVYIMCISVQVHPLEPPLVTGEGSKMDESGSGFAWRPGKDKLGAPGGLLSAFGCPNLVFPCFPIFMSCIGAWSTELTHCQKAACSKMLQACCCRCTQGIWLWSTPFVFPDKEPRAHLQMFRALCVCRHTQNVFKLFRPTYRGSGS